MEKLKSCIGIVEYDRKVMPYRPYRQGEMVQVVPNTNFSYIVKSYYPKSNLKLLVDSVFVNDDTVKYDYLAVPVGYSEKLEITHWNVRPDKLVESRMFVPAITLQSGVAIRNMHTGKHNVIKESRAGVVFFDDDSYCDRNDLCEILRREDDSDQLVSFLRG